MTYDKTSSDKILIYNELICLINIICSHFDHLGMVEILIFIMFIF